MAVTEQQTAEARLDEARQAGVKRVRVHFTDLTGISRNKVVPLTMLEELTVLLPNDALVWERYAMALHAA